MNERLSFVSFGLYIKKTFWHPPRYKGTFRGLLRYARNAVALSPPSIWREAGGEVSLYLKPKPPTYIIKQRYIDKKAHEFAYEHKNTAPGKIDFIKSQRKRKHIAYYRNPDKKS